MADLAAGVAASHHQRDAPAYGRLGRRPDALGLLPVGHAVEVTHQRVYVEAVRTRTAGHAFARADLAGGAGQPVALEHLDGLRVVRNHVVDNHFRRDFDSHILLPAAPARASLIGPRGLMSRAATGLNLVAAA